MNDFKYVLINLICFLMMSCGAFVHGSNQSAQQTAAQEVAAARLNFSQMMTRRFPNIQTPVVRHDLVAGLTENTKQ